MIRIFELWLYSGRVGSMLRSLENDPMIPAPGMWR